MKLWKIFPVSPPALNTIARAYVLDFTFWAWWAWDEGYLFDSGHCVSPISMDRVELFPPWAFVGSRLWGPLERWVHYCWAIDGQNVIVFVRTVTADFYWSWLATWFGYQVPSVSYLQPWRIWQQNHKSKLRTTTLFQLVNKIYYIKDNFFFLEKCYIHNIFIILSQQITNDKLLLVLI